MVRSKDDEARIHLLKVFQTIQKIRDDDSGSTAAPQMPSIDFRL